jgi:hypothetical protein
MKKVENQRNENVIRNNLLYATVIESNGRVGKQFTFLGSALILAITLAVGAVAFLSIGYAAALLR